MGSSILKANQDVKNFDTAIIPGMTPRGLVNRRTVSEWSLAE
jgi:hypothetical protein